jgi:hypothetical protein
MYNLSKENDEFLNNLSMGLRPRSFVTSIAIGKALADSCALPTSKVDDIQAVYRVSEAIRISNILSTINERAFIDFETILVYTLKFYEFRYMIAHPRGKVYCLNKETAVTDFFGLNQILDEEAIDMIKNNSLEITDTYNSMVCILAELAAKG